MPTKIIIIFVKRIKNIILFSFFAHLPENLKMR